MKLEKRRMVVSAGEMAYVDEGEGQAVVFLHGFPTSSHLWRDVAPLLAPRARVVAPDLMGYGDSEKPDARLDVRAQAGYVRELLEGLGVRRAAAVGHGLGGGVALLLAVGGAVDALVLLDSVVLDSRPPEPVRAVQGAGPREADVSFVERAVRLAFDAGMGHRERLAEEDLEEFVRPWREEPTALVRAARGIDGAGLPVLEGRPAGLEVPAFVVWGEDDPWEPADSAERLGELLPRSTVALLPGCSHFVMEDAPETVGPMVAQFLRTQYLAESAPSRGGAVPVDLGVSFRRPDEPVGLPDE